MRPLSITLEGFSAYRNRQTVSLENVEFFSLSGQTGSGKSSLIDAMIFALYGRVPRLGARAVAPVITAGVDRARVSLDFEVRGEGYVVSRVAERTDSGASVREARLERSDGTSLAGGAGEVTREVEELLRLRFEDFTKTVVLPQGEFARFLNAGSRERRELLRDLLGLDVYTRVRELAADRRSEAAGRAGSARSQLESLDVPAEGDMETARARLGVLEELSGEIGDQLKKLGEAESAIVSRESRIEDIDDARARLAGISPPRHLDEMDERLAEARATETSVEETLTARRSETETLAARIAELPAGETIANHRRAHEELAEIEQRISALDTATARAEVEAAETALEESEVALSDARNVADAARSSHAAHVVRAGIAVGEPCPVCFQVVDAIPDAEPPPELAEVDSAVAAARKAVAASRESLEEKRARSTELVARASELGSHREKVVARVTQAPAPDELDLMEGQLDELTASLRDVRAEVEQLETTLKRARREHEDAAEAVRSVGRALMVAREEVADLKPPHAESDDPTIQWKDFLSWRDGATEGLVGERDEILSDLQGRRQSLEEMQRELATRLESAGVAPEKPYDVTVARELEVARSQFSRMEETMKRSVALQEELAAAEHTEAVAGALANHLRANGFERWLMAGAITGLVSGANALLDQLSGGGYSLESDEEGSFRIIDHRNADEIRDVATLSGGETFLVSLALSLSLAETLSAAGGAGLDAIILDEGFGTLDEESLDVVAAVLEELAGRGLMVGVITHVKELAARAQVRYRVTRQPEGSRVELVS